MAPTLVLIEKIGGGKKEDGEEGPLTPTVLLRSNRYFEKKEGTGGQDEAGGDCF